MENEINIGDVFYIVNRDDRKSTIENHRFTCLEITSITKDDSVWAFGTNNAPIDLYGFIKTHRNSYKENIKQFYVANRDRSQVAVMGTSIVEIKKTLETALGRKVYSDKESSKEELKDLLEGELKETNRRIESMLEAKTILEKRLKTYE